MTKQAGNLVGPRGGLQAGAGAVRGWRWERNRERLVSAPVRCKRDQCYLARGTVTDAKTLTRAPLAVRFLRDGCELYQRSLTLHTRNGHTAELLGWIQTPEDATHLQVLLTPDVPGEGMTQVTFHAVFERDPKCHPLANVPRWSAYQPPFAIERLILPESLSELAAAAPELAVSHSRPRSRAALANDISGAACVLDAAWVDHLELSWEDVLRLASRSWLIIDLDTAGRLLSRAGVKGLELFTARSPHGIMSARVEYADVQTRGFALQDVFPYGTLGESGFEARALRANRAWRRLADELALATLLASETPAPDRSGHVMSAAAPTGRGELMITDLPWLAAGAMGTPIAPRLARHALRMHLALPLEDDLQYWNRWDDSQILVRDLCDLARRYPPLEVVRWAPSSDGHARLGLVLPARDAGAARTVLIRTGRIDNSAPHDGLPPEPIMIIMKQLAREVREATAWGRRYLATANVVWQFDTAAGLRYTVNYPSADTLPVGAIRSYRLRGVGGAVCDSRLPGEAVLTLEEDEGVFGDGSLSYLARVMGQIRKWIEAGSGA